MLYRQLSHHQRLQARRHPMFEKNMAMKIFSYISVAIMAVYLVALGVLLYFALDGSAFEAFDWIDGGMIWFLILDFLFRFVWHETPAQNVKPYKLMNVPVKFLLNVFLVRTGFQSANLVWAFFFVPFGLLSVPQFYGMGGLIGFWIGWWLVFVLNSYWYLVWRTLINRNFCWCIVPLALLAALAYFGIFFDEANQWLFLATIHLMRGFCLWNPLCWLIVLGVIAVLYVVNYHIQQKAVYAELANVEEVKQVKVNNMAFLDKFGIIGEYLKLELKSTMRNQVVRKQFITGVFCMLLFCVLLAFSDIYDNMKIMQVFICIYCFTCISVMTLTGVMCAEGNYIDGLMVRKETVLSLLKAKYYFQCLILVVPFLFSLMPVGEGKVSFLTILGCFLFTSGAVFPLLFQLAVYNDATLHLNEKLTKSGRGTKMQMIVSSAAMYVSTAVMYLLVVLFDDEIAAISMIAIGLVGTVLHPLWLRNIYSRFMQRRYKNMDNFRNSR